MSLGVKALATYPLKSSKRDPGLRDVPVSFAGAPSCTGETFMLPAGIVQVPELHLLCLMWRHVTDAANAQTNLRLQGSLCSQAIGYMLTRMASLLGPPSSRYNLSSSSM